jgi:hypothetical protein
MDKQYLTLFLIGIMAIFLIGNASAELSLWSNQLMNSNSHLTHPSTVQDHFFYQFDDTSIEGYGKNKPIITSIYYVIQPLPYSLGAYGGNVDSCELVILQSRNNYNEDGKILNETIESLTINFSTNASADSGTLRFYLKSDDTLTGDIYCHYTNSSTLYADNILVGRFTTFVPSFECAGCSDKSLEVLTNELDTLDSRLSDQSAVYSILQGIINFNFSVWLILKWLISFSFLLVAIGLLFYSMYFIYSMIKNLEREL